MIRLKPYEQKDIREDDIQGIHDFIADADIVEGLDTLYALVCRGMARTAQVKPPKPLMN